MQPQEELSDASLYGFVAFCPFKAGTFDPIHVQIGFLCSATWGKHNSQKGQEDIAKLHRQKKPEVEQRKRFQEMSPLVQWLGLSISRQKPPDPCLCVCLHGDTFFLFAVS